MNINCDLLAQGVHCSYPMAELPYFGLWKNEDTKENGYVVRPPSSPLSSTFFQGGFVIAVLLCRLGSQP